MSRDRQSTVDTTDESDQLVSTDPGRGGLSEETERTTDRETRPVIAARNLDVYYGETQAIDDVTIQFSANRVTAIIGPSGCEKSTFLRCINRMNDLVDVARIEGELLFEGTNVYDESVDPVALRRRIGMVFQQPNPFSKSIYDNVAYGLRVQSSVGAIRRQVLDSC